MFAFNTIMQGRKNMIRIRKITSLFICLALALCLLASCVTTPDTPVSGSDASDTSSQEAIDLDAYARELYAAAKAEYGDLKDYAVDYTVENDITIGFEHFFETETFRSEITGSGGWDMRVEKTGSVSGTGEISSYEETRSEWLSGETLYVSSTRDGETRELYAETRASDYAAAMLPPLLIDIDKYELVTGSENGDGGFTVTLSDASDIEGWVSEYATGFKSAEAQMTFDAEGKLLSTVYRAEYRRGGANISAVITASAQAFAPEGEGFGEPENKRKFTRNDNLSDILMTAEALWRLENSRSLAIEREVVVASYAMGFYSDSTVNEYCFGADGYSMLSRSASTDIEYYDFKKNKYRDASENYYAEYQHGDVIMTKNGKTSTERYDPESTDVVSILFEDNTAVSALLSGATDYVYQNSVGDFFLCTCTPADEYLDASAEYAKGQVAGYTSKDQIKLLNESSEFSHDNAFCTLSVDRYTLLPVYAEYQYAGVYDIEGETYPLYHFVFAQISAGTSEPYETMTGEPFHDRTTDDVPTPLLYKVTSDDGHEMWLFGTIHLGDDRTAYLPDYVYTALDKCDALAVEFDVEAFDENNLSDKEMEAIYKVYYSDGPFADSLPDDLYQSVMMTVAASGAYSTRASSFNCYGLYELLGSTYQKGIVSLTAQKGVDRRLIRRANRKRIEVLSIESFLSQTELALDYSDKTIELLLAEMCAMTRHEYVEEANSLFEAWCRGDEQELIRLINEENEFPDDVDEEYLNAYEEYCKIMMSDRNAFMLETAKGYLEGDKRVFFAVGLAHLLSEDGLVNSLREAGYTVEKVS